MMVSRGNGTVITVEVARQAPAFGGWFLGRLATLAHRSPQLFVRLATSELPAIDRRTLAQPALPEAVLAGYAEAFRCGSGPEGVRVCHWVIPMTVSPVVLAG